MKKTVLTVALLTAVFALLIGSCASSEKGSASSGSASSGKTQPQEFVLAPLADGDYEIRQNPDNTITITGIKTANTDTAYRTYANRDAVIPETLYGLQVVEIDALALGV